MPERSTNDFDKLYKTHPLRVFVNNKFKEMFQLSDNWSVDESLVAFNGRHNEAVHADEPCKVRLQSASNSMCTYYILHIHIHILIPLKSTLEIEV